jgi:putative phosphoesterase
MRIAVISDTHDRLPPHVAEAIAAADEIWHLGDVTTKALLASVREIGPPVRNVRGNCDFCADWPETDDLELQGFKIRLIHIPPKRPPAGFDLLLHGHTHVPRDEMIGGVRYLNPGCISKANKGAPPSYAWLTLEVGEPPAWKVQRL